MKNIVIVSLVCILAGLFVRSTATHAKLRAENQQWREAASRAAVVYTADGFSAAKAVDPQALASIIERNYRLIEEMKRELRGWGEGSTGSALGTKMAKN